jgi:heat shock protein HslJ
LAVAALAVAGAFPLLSAGAANASPTPPADEEVCELVDFQTATVQPVGITAGMPGTTINELTVTGEVSASNVKVHLEKLVYIRQPEFWGIEVIGCRSGFGAQVITPYKATIQFAGALGTCGIEVIGASTSQTIDLAGCTASLAGTNWVLDPASLGVPIPAGRTITANFSDTNVSGNASCNLYSAPYKTGPGGAFKVGAIITTKIACLPDNNRSEQAYLGKLAKASAFQLSRGELRLLADGTTLLRFTPAPVKLPPLPR